MKQLLKSAGIFGIIIVFLSNSYSLARDYNFQWTANPEPVDGYKICYGLTLAELNAMSYCDDMGKPPTVGGNCYGTVYNRDETKVNFFAALAYYGSEESGLSKIVITGFLPTTAINTSADYDGDNVIDPSCKIGEGYWLIDYSADGDVSPNSQTCGSNNWDEIVAGYVGTTSLPYPMDYDWDGKTDIVVEYPTTGICYINVAATGLSTWDGIANGFQCSKDYQAAINPPSQIGVQRGNQFIRRDKNGNILPIIAFGNPTGDIGMTGDWDGDGADEIGVQRGNQFIRRDKNGNILPVITFGLSTDIGFSGDWDGNGADEIGVFRPSNNTFYLRKTDGTYISIPFGLSTDKPVIGDWDGNRIDEIGVQRSNQFIRRNSNGSLLPTILFGNPTGDIGITGDWDSDGADEIGVKRGNQYIRRDDSGGIFPTITFGLTTDIGLTGKW